MCFHLSDLFQLLLLRPKKREREHEMIYKAVVQEQVRHGMTFGCKSSTFRDFKYCLPKKRNVILKVSVIFGLNLYTYVYYEYTDEGSALWVLC